MEKVTKSEAQWRKQLSPAEYAVLRQAGTEAAFTGEYTDTKTTGVYRANSTGRRNTFMWRWANGATTGMGSCADRTPCDAFAWAASGGQARTPAAVLGGDRQGNV
jgi:hypothetical protein